VPTDFRNHSGCPALCFEHVNAQGERRSVLVARVALKIGGDGALTRLQPQPPFNFKERPFEQAGRNASECSLQLESDLAPEKPLVDVVVHGTAHAPSDPGARRFSVHLDIEEPGTGCAFGASTAGGFRSVGSWSLDVYGPSVWRWRHPLSRFVRGVLCVASLALVRPSPWRRTWTEPVSSVPLRYERAHGGRLELRDDDRTHVFCDESNPSGTGWMPTIAAVRAQLGLSRFAAWRLRRRLAAQHPVLPAAQVWPGGATRPYRPDQPADVGGWGGIAKPWLPRRRHAGTYDASWEETRHPLLPLDFDARYWNGAHPLLQLPVLSAAARLRLVGLVPAAERADRTIRMELPGLRFTASVREPGTAERLHELRLDTVHADLDAREVVLLYRANLALIDGVVALRCVGADSVATNALRQDLGAPLHSKERSA
jgi:hypothetical protein